MITLKLTTYEAQLILDAVNDSIDAVQAADTDESARREVASLLLAMRNKILTAGRRYERQRLSERRRAR